MNGFGVFFPDHSVLPGKFGIAGERFIVYGLRKNATHGNCQLKEFSEDGFVDDLAGAKAVVANGGLSLIGEAVFIGLNAAIAKMRAAMDEGRRLTAGQA